MKSINKFRKNHTFLFCSCTIGLIFNIIYGLTLKTPVWFGDADIINYFLSNFLGILFWGIITSTIFYYINVWIPEEKKLESLSYSIDKYRIKCIKLFDSTLAVMITNCGWKVEEQAKIIKQLKETMLTKDQVNMISINFHKNPEAMKIRDLMSSRIYPMLDCIYNLRDRYDDYISADENKLLAELSDSLFIRDFVTNDGSLMYEFYSDIQKLKTFITGSDKSIW